MGDRRRRNRKLMREEKRFASLSSDFKNVSIQPKILLKTKNDNKNENKTVTSGDQEQLQHHYGTRESTSKSATVTTVVKNTQSPARSSTIPKEIAMPSNNETSSQSVIVEQVPQMTRPATIISSVGMILDSAKKLLHKTNTDFMVVGVIGTQGVGKSTILNLLANEKSDFDYYRKVFMEEDFIFPTKLKLNKCASRSRTESTHMFITSDRLILLDTPPVMTNAYKKDATRCEMDDLTNIITLMSACHLLIVVIDDYFNLNFLNMLRYAELMKRPQDVKPFLADYYPNILFIKNRAKRLDYAPANQMALEEILGALFKDSQLRIHFGQTMANTSLDEKVKKRYNTEEEKCVNLLLFPEIESENGTAYHAPLTDIVEQLRRRVFHTPRNQMYAGSNDLTEELWFDWLSEVSENNMYCNEFFKTYEEVQRKYLDTTPGFGGIIGKESSSPESWRD